VSPLDKIIPREVLLKHLTEEASDFIAELLSIQLPASGDRLNVPVLRTPEKDFLEASNRTELEVFLEERCFYVPGAMTTFKDFYESFISTLEGSEVMKWSKIRVGKSMPQDLYPKGRRSDATWCFGNLALEPEDDKSNAYKLVRKMDSEFLVEKQEIYNG